MVFDYEADCSYNTKMLPLPYTSNCGECSRDFGTQAVRGGLCAAVTLPLCSRARIGIIPHSLLNQGLSLLFPTPPPRPASFAPTQRIFSLFSKQPSFPQPPRPEQPCHSCWKPDGAQLESGEGKINNILIVTTDQRHSYAL